MSSRVSAALAAFGVLFSILSQEAAGASTGAESGTRPSHGYLNLRLKSFPSFVSSHWEERTEDAVDAVLAENTSTLGHSYGAEIDVYLARFCLRGTYQEGAYDFADRGDARYTSAGIDVGLLTGSYSSAQGLVLVGHRWIVAERSYVESFAIDNRRLTYEELIFGIVMESKPGKKGFVFGAEADFSVRGLPNLFRTEGEVEHMGVDLGLEIGVRLRTLPIAVTLGGAVQIYQFQYETAEDPGPSIADFLGNEKVDATYGPTMKVSYVCSLW